MSGIKELEQWYSKSCDGDWEHTYGIKISTLDNPGWLIDICLNETSLENKLFKEITIERNDNDWIYCEVRDKVFRGRGGPGNLEELINIFMEWAT